MFSGSIVAIVTPFANGTVYIPTLKKLLDWHISEGTQGNVPCGTTGESATFTQMGTMLGTPTYMSPEQMRGEPADGRADLWAAGVMLYEMLAGRGPFAAATVVEVMQNAMALEPAPLSSLVAGLPVSLDAVLRRALARRREDRFQEAGDFARELMKVAAAAADAVDLELAFEPATTTRLE